MSRNSRRFKAGEYVEGLLSGDRIMLSRAITVIESTHKDDEVLAYEILKEILPHSGKSVRIGLTGAPGVGKSTFIEAFGKEVLKENKRIAVLTIDPSSSKTKGSILGDKTRMSDLSKNPSVFIRPSAAGETLGGIASKTREVMLLCEAAGFDTIIIETVGVGQSETLVKGMVDYFLLLMLAGSGDELQGIKRGIVELADMVVITKADLDNLERAKKTQKDFNMALKVLKKDSEDDVPVLLCSAITHHNIPQVHDRINKRINKLKEAGEFSSNRKKQSGDWMHEIIKMKLLSSFYSEPSLAPLIAEAEKSVVNETIEPTRAANELLKCYFTTRFNSNK